MLEPTNPYAATKAGAELLAKAYYRSFKLPLIITRGNNVYGPHQYPEKIIPKFVNQLLRGRPLTLHGDGSNTRNYLYVEDCAAAFDVILHNGTIGHIYNIGSDNEVANVDLAIAYARGDFSDSSSYQLTAIGGLFNNGDLTPTAMLWLGGRLGARRASPSELLFGLIPN